MVMCSVCNKRLAVVFISKYENGEKKNQGLCIKCAKEAGVPVDSMLDDMSSKFGLSREMIEGMEDSMEGLLAPSDNDDNIDGGAPAIDLPKLFSESGLMPNGGNADKDKKANKDRQKKDQKGAENKKEYKFLTTYCRNLTQYARAGRLDKIVGREAELARIIQILGRRQKNNPCLIGEPGVGKTAIAEALAIKIATGDVPYRMKNKEVYLVDLTALVAGTQFRGQYESRVLGLLNDVRAAGNVILVIDEVHNIVGNGDAEGSLNAANILKPALSRGEVQVIGATTLTEYRKYIEKDAALERRFQPVTVNEPSIDDAVKMLSGIKHYYEEYHKISIPQEILRRAVVLSERYITDRYLPDKAIDLIDEAASHLSLSSNELNENYELRDELLKLKTRREDIESAGDDDNSSSDKFEEIAKIKAREMQISERLEVLRPECDSIAMSVSDLARVIELWTGIPATSITENEYERIDKLEERLKTHIVGQDKAVSAVAKAIKRNRAGISYKRKPVSFIFAGPTGVGKTELVKCLAEDLFNSPETLIRLDMSEFMEKHSVSRIIGSPPGYVGYDDAGQLTEKIRRRPYSIVLFDEIEKAHPDVLNILLQILDDGRITDAHGKTVNFENTVIVMTTNAGSDSTSGIVGFSQNSEMQADAKTDKALSSFLRPEFMNRVDEIITFRGLDKDDFARIAEIMLGQLKTALEEKDITVAYSSDVATFVGEKSFSVRYGARNMRRFIQREIEDKLANVLISDYDHIFTHVNVSVKDGEIDLECI